MRVLLVNSQAVLGWMMMGLLVCIGLIIMLTILDRRSEEVTFSAIIGYSIFWAVARFLQQRWVWLLRDAESFSIYELDKNSTARGEEILHVRFDELVSLKLQLRRYGLVAIVAERKDGTKVNVLFRVRAAEFSHIEHIAADFERASHRSTGKEEEL